MYPAENRMRPAAVRTGEGKPPGPASGWSTTSQAHGRARTCRTPTIGAALSAATIAVSRIGLPVQVVSTCAPPFPSARRREPSHRARGKGITMPWVRDLQSPRGTWLRTLVVLGLVFAIVAESPLRQSWGALTWLNPGGTGTVAESVLPPLDVLGEPDLAAAAKRKGDKQDKGTDKSEQKAEKSDKRKGGQTKYPGEDKDRHPGGGNGGGNGKHQGDGKRDT